MGENDKLEGTLLVKKGASAAENQGDNGQDAKVRTCMGGNAGLRPQYRRARDADVHDSESCPQELLPLRVLISTNDLDVRHESGMDLPLVFKGRRGYGELDNEWGYKYVYGPADRCAARLFRERSSCRGKDMSAM